MDASSCKTKSGIASIAANIVDIRLITVLCKKGLLVVLNRRLGAMIDSFEEEKGNWFKNTFAKP